jgi:hypothetical protein
MKTKKEEAIELRKSGKSYNDIRRILGTPKSTLSNWLNDVELTRGQKDELLNRNIVNGKKRGNFTSGDWDKKRLNVYDSYEPPLDDVFFVFGLSMYWAEGHKSLNELRMTNSDERILVLFVNWILKYFGDFSFVGGIYHHYPERDNEIKEYWASKIKIERFYPSQIVLNNGSRKNVYLNGILSLTVIGKSKWIIKEKIRKSIDRLTEKYGLIIGI